MGFASGSVSFRRFAVIGNDQPEQIDQDLLDKLAGHALRVGEVGVPEEIEYGWAGGRHILDGSFSFENNVYGDALFFALRVDTNKVPGDLKRAYTMMEEDAVAATNPSGFISKMQKRDVKDVVRRKVDDDMRSGRFRRSKLLQIVWDVPSATLYCAANGPALEQLLECPRIPRAGRVEHRRIRLVIHLPSHPASSPLIVRFAHHPHKPQTEASWVLPSTPET